MPIAAALKAMGAAAPLGVLIGGHIAGDGRSNWYKGIQLVAFYLVLATTFYLIPPASAGRFGRSP